MDGYENELTDSDLVTRLVDRRAAEVHARHVDVARIVADGRSRARRRTWGAAVGAGALVAALAIGAGAVGVGGPTANPAGGGPTNPAGTSGPTDPTGPTRSSDVTQWGGCTLEPGSCDARAMDAWSRKVTGAGLREYPLSERQPAPTEEPGRKPFLATTGRAFGTEDRSGGTVGTTLEIAISPVADEAAMWDLSQRNFDHTSRSWSTRTLDIGDGIIVHVATLDAGGGSATEAWVVRERPGAHGAVAVVMHKDVPSGRAVAPKGSRLAAGVRSELRALLLGTGDHRR